MSNCIHACARIVQRAALALFTLTLLAGAGCSHATHDPATLVIATVEEPDSLDPRYANLAVANDAIALAYDGLVKFGPHGELLPDLAAAVPSYANGGISADGRTIVYHLRRGVRWQDGTPFTARDVLYTYASLVDPHGNVPAHGGYDDIASVTAPDPWTVRVRLKHPYAPALSLFANTRQGAIVPAHATTTPIGTGPYRVVAWHRGDEIVFARNPYAFVRPHFERVVLRFMPNEQSIVNALHAGDVDVALHLSVPTLARLHGDRTLAVHASPTLQWEHLTFNLRPGSGPQANVHVRRAIAYALDPPRILAEFFGNEGGLAPLDQAPTSWARDAALGFYPHDAAAARRELALAGIPHPSLTLLSTTGNDERYRLEIAIQSACKAVGIDVAIKNVPANMLLARAVDRGLLTGGRFEFALFSYVAISPDPDDARFVSSQAIPPQGVNMSAYANARVDALERTAVGTFDRAARIRAYHAIQAQLMRDLPFYTLLWPADAVVAKPGLIGPAAVPVGSQLWNVADWHRGATAR